MSDNSQKTFDPLYKIPIFSWIFWFCLFLIVSGVLSAHISIFVSNFAQVIFMAHTAFMVVMSQYLSQTNLAILNGLATSAFVLYIFNRIFR